MFTLPPSPWVLRQGRTWKILPESQWEADHTSTEMYARHGLAWLTAAHMFPGVWTRHCSTPGVREIGARVYHLKTLAAVHAGATEKVLNAGMTGLLQCPHWATVDQISSGAVKSPVCHWNTGRLLGTCVWQKLPGHHGENTLCCKKSAMHLVPFHSTDSRYSKPQTWQQFPCDSCWALHFDVKV